MMEDKNGIPSLIAPQYKMKYDAEKLQKILYWDA